MPESLVTRPEQPSDDRSVEALQRAAFGPGAYARAAFRVREQAPHDPSLSFVTEIGGRLIGSVRLTPIRIGAARGHLLGPLVVDAAFEGQGHGKELVRVARAAASRAGSPFVILVGDEPYYGPLGFKHLPAGRVRMPGPVDPERLLVAELQPSIAETLCGMVQGFPARISGS